MPSAWLPGPTTCGVGCRPATAIPRAAPAIWRGAGTRVLDLAADLGPEKAVDVLAKTLKKMTPRGRSEALELELTPEGRSALEQALASVGSSLPGGA